MALFQKSFDSYLVYYRCGPDGVGPWAGGYRALVNCYAANSYVGGLRFLAEGVALPANTGGPNSIELHYPVSALSDILGILRYEKPLRLDFHDDTLVGVLSTTAEPIGEQEGV
ncbi:hypothetical protein ACFXGA_34160 [Actinosynnema sp. NPDC059335]|uniref:hypothetical protein n=1 Tax=Actinosynnema sp. NPDC059335 TaxID=3346804 RepID=UPI003671C133